MKKIGIIKRKHVYLVLLAFAACNAPVESEPTSDLYDGVEFEMPRVTEPTFSDYSVVVTDFGAIGDGQTLNTAAFAEAIKNVSEKGGGKVIVPEGIWLTGPIVFESNLNLHLEKGSLILFSDNKDLYPLVKTSFEGLNTVRCQSPIYAKNVENIAITGDGVIDGSGDAWRQVKREKMTDSQWKKLVASGGIVDEAEESWYPSESFKKGSEISDMNVPINFTKMEQFQEIRDFLRPVMVSLVGCKNVLLDGPVFQNSPAWNIHPLMCENLIVRNLTVRNPWYSQNGDGIDIESCKNTVLTNCSFDVGDDAICIKSGKDKEGRERNMPTENLIIKDCIVYHGHGGVTVGSEMSSGVKNMHVSSCTFIGTDVGLRFKSNRGRGGVVEGIYISDINMIDIPTNAISFNLYYGGLSVSEMMEEENTQMQSDEVFPVTEETPQFKDISIKNIICKGANQAIYLQGLPEMNLEDVVMENLVMEAKNGLVCMDAKGIQIDGLHLKTEVSPALVFSNVKDVAISGLDVPGDASKLIAVKGSETKNIHLKVKNAVAVDGLLDLGEEVNAQEVKVEKH